MNTLELIPLKKHTYPTYLRYSCITSILLAVIVIPYFLIYELPLHKNINQLLASADNFFSKKQYQDAIPLYQTILKKFSNCSNPEQLKIKLAQACFALSENDEAYYIQGWEYLDLKKYSDASIKELLLFVPSSYKYHFNSQFKRT